MNTKKIAVLIITVYLIFRLFLDSFWQSISVYYSYLFEIFFVITTCLILKDRLSIKFNQKDFLFSIIALLSGYGIYILSGQLGISIPFDLTGSETIFLLLFVAPLLEELVFHQALWAALKKLHSSPAFLIFTSTLLFSAGHFTSLFSVPNEFKTFILYQTAYVVLLGLLAGFRRFQSQSIGPAIVVHFFFNLGFFIASKL